MSVKVNFSLGKLARATPKIMAQLINDVGALVITDTIQGVRVGQDQANRAFVPLKPATIAQKSKKGAQVPSRALWDTGRMVEGMFLKKKASPSRLNALVALAGNRVKIGGFHQAGEGVHTRVWFPEKATPRISKRMLPLLRSAERKLVKAVK